MAFVDQVPNPRQLLHIHIDNKEDHLLLRLLIKGKGFSILDADKHAVFAKNLQSLFSCLAAYGIEYNFDIFQNLVRLDSFVAQNLVDLKQLAKLNALFR